MRPNRTQRHAQLSDKVSSTRVTAAALLIALSSGGFLAGCAHDSSGTHEAGGTAQVTTQVWELGELRLEVLNGKPVNERVVRVGARQPTLQVGADGRIFGLAGVNRYTGQVDTAALGRGVWSSGPIASTRMAGPPGANELEQEFLAALASASVVRVAGRRVSLLSEEHGLAVFVQP